MLWRCYDSIQQKLFLKSDPNRARGVTVINPFLASIISNSDDRWDCELLIEDDIDSHRRFAISQTIATQPYEMCASEYLSTYIHPTYAGPPRPSHQSWAKMLVTDPPCAIKICYGSRYEQIGPNPEMLMFLPEYTSTPVVENTVDLIRAIELLQYRKSKDHF